MMMMMMTCYLNLLSEGQIKYLIRERGGIHLEDRMESTNKAHRNLLTNTKRGDCSLTSFFFEPFQTHT